jgi:type II secretory pathway pseudopilin PulG
MVELLTVIAVIAILAAIIFPVFSVVRRNVHKAQCTSNLHSLAQAIKLYKDDYRAYPDALYGYLIEGGGERTFLYPQYIRDKSGFRCPVNPHQLSNPEPRPGIHGTFGIPMTIDATGARVAYPIWDSYDGSLVPHNAPTSPYVVHYLKKWTPGLVGATDEPRQLIYRTPPDNTVVTWCTYHRDYRTDGQPSAGSTDLVLYLDGRVKPTPSQQTANEVRAHQVVPNT